MNDKDKDALVPILAALILIAFINAVLTFALAYKVFGGH